MDTAPNVASETHGPDGLSIFMAVRPHLFGIAYRVLRSGAEAEEIVQDAWIRWQTTDRSVVRDPTAFLTTTTKRLAINVLQSARSRREMGGASPLPEPVDPSGDQVARLEQSEALASGMLALLEKLPQPERAAFILREAFEYSYRTIAEVLGLQDANARQLVRRARQHLSSGRRSPVSADEHTRLLAGFIAAAHCGDVASLELLLSRSAVRSSLFQRTGACAWRTMEGNIEGGPPSQQPYRARRPTVHSQAA
jgi:RNA polymerase sigma-70 factor (ECF subfamily)